MRTASADTRVACAALHVVLVLMGMGCRPHGPRPERRKLTLYCSAQIEWCQVMATEFEARTGIRVSMTRKGSGETYAQIWAERKNPRGDVWWGGTGDSHIQAAEAKLTEPYRSPKLDELHPWAIDPAGTGEHRATGIYMGALGFGYNRDWLRKKGLPEPRRWSDLVDPIFRGEIQMAHPSSSGTAYTVLVTILELYGEERGWSYLRLLHANVNEYTKSGSAPIRAAARGETGIGIVFLHDAMTQRRAGFPIEEVAPEEGTGFEIGCVSVIHGARHIASAKRFVDWALGKEAQDLARRAESHQVPSNRTASVSEGVFDLARARLIPLDYRKYGRRAEKTRLLERWASEVGGGAR